MTTAMREAAAKVAEEIGARDIFEDHRGLCRATARDIARAIRALPVPQADEAPSDVVARVARALEPKLFSDDSDTAHMAALPFKLEIMQERAREQARAAIAALPRDQIEAAR